MTDHPTTAARPGIRARADHRGATKRRIYHDYRSKAGSCFDVQITTMNRLMAWFTPRRLRNSEDAQEPARIHAVFLLRGLRREADR